MTNYDIYNERNNISCNPQHYSDRNDRETVEILETMNVNLLDPSTPNEENMADALDAFSSFVLEEQREECRGILQRHLKEGDGSSVGVLQGGNETEEIYRVVIDDDENNDDAKNRGYSELIEAFVQYHGREGKKYAKWLTLSKFQDYMLGMCDQRSSMLGTSQHCTKIHNPMFILTFGKTIGQVRHIDKMNPNLQICLYMSSECPTTILYHLEEPGIRNGRELIEYWEEQQEQVPDLLRFLLSKAQTTKILSKEYPRTTFLSSWKTIDFVLHTFGKLYRPVASSLSFTVNSGTTLIAGGNEVHAGPPTTGPRMFAFAVGLVSLKETNDESYSYKNYEEEDCWSSNGGDNGNNEEEDNAVHDGEIQYCPALLHADLICILFVIMDELPNDEEEIVETKRFLLQILLELVRDQPQETYERLLPDDRSELRDWMGSLARAVVENNSYSVEKLLSEALHSDSIFYPPILRKQMKKERRRRERRKKTKK